MPQKSPEWQQVRKGVVTGTTLKQIMGGAKAYDSAFYEIVSERLTVGLDEEEYESDIDRGNRLEPEAIAEFELETGLVVEKIGFAESDSSKFVGQSPDGLIGETEAIEVKCPAGKNHVRIWFTDQVPEVSGCDYKDQVVMYFVVNDKLQKLYFVSYNPKIPVHPLHIIEVTRESIAEDIEIAKQKVTEFLEKVEAKMSEIITL